jgi:hypothetical protein
VVQYQAFRNLTQQSPMKRAQPNTPIHHISTLGSLGSYTVGNNKLILPVAAISWYSDHDTCLNRTLIKPKSCIKLNFFHLLAWKQNLEKFSIYSNKFFHYFHLSESSFTSPGLQASGLARRLYMISIVFKYEHRSESTWKFGSKNKNWKT